MKISVAQLGARRHYAVPEILHGAGTLHKLFTDAYGGKWPFAPLSWLPGLVRPRFIRRIAGRRARIPAGLVRAFQSFGIEYAWKLRHATTRTDTTRIHLWAGQRFDEVIIAEGLDGCDCVYGFGSASETLFRKARTSGIRTVLDQIIAPRALEAELMAEERRRWPAWEDFPRDECASLYSSRERNEWQLADLIVCGSTFVACSLSEMGIRQSKCKVIPGGVEIGRFKSGPTKNRSCHALRVLFVGSVGLRKGMPYLLKAATQFQPSQVVVRVVGPVACDENALRSSCPSNAQIVGLVARNEVAKHYAWADVFCLPSICEGSAGVVYEALAAGLPVITTPNAGSIVRDGIEGFIVPIRDADAIAEAVELLATEQRLLRDMSEAANERSEFGSLEAYGRRLVDALSELVPRH